MMQLTDPIQIFSLGMVFLFGICIGSFLNVVIYRVPKEISIIKGFSQCTACQQRIRARDLIPLVSYLLLGRKCRDCKAPISWRYFGVELLTGVVFVSLYLKFGFSDAFFFFSFLMSVLIAVFFIDYDEMIIPDGLVITGLVGGGILYIYHTLIPFSYYGPMAWWGPLLGFLLGPFILIVLAIIGSAIFGAEAMGGGDIKLYAPLGIFLGWKMMLVSLFIAFVVSGIVGALLLLLKKKEKRSEMPFGPFIVIATYVTILFGHEMVAWYLSGLQH